MNTNSKKILLSSLLTTGAAVSAATILRKPSVSAWKLRTMFGIADFFRDFGVKEPEDVEKITDLIYGEDPMQRMDVYYPKDRSGILPTIISFHGGAYVYGDKEGYRHYCMRLAQNGFTVINFSYRLAPKHRFPTQLQDANAAIRFIMERGKEYPVDPDNIFFVGDSAGAHLAAMYSAAKTNPKYAGLLGLNIPTFDLKAIALNCGIYHNSDLEGITSFIQDGDAVEYEEKMNLFGYINEDFPPAFVMSANRDICLAFAEPFSDYLTEKGIDTQMHIYGDEEHAYGHVFHLNSRSKIAEICNRVECAFFEEYML